LCASIGAAQATEAIKLLTGIGNPLVGRLQLYDALAGSWRELAVGKDPDCAVCGQHPTITELVDYDLWCGELPRAPSDPGEGTISVRRLAHWLDERERGERDFVLVDVREPYEREINHIPGSVLMPMETFRTGEGLARLPADKQPVFYCKVGVRSAEVLAIARRAGSADAVHVGGGVTAWVAEVDPSQPAY
jgi:adenylyltransferase/sulfurtransferase